jgi:hypothetical protein
MNDCGKNEIQDKWQGFEQMWQGFAQAKKQTYNFAMFLL